MSTWVGQYEPLELFCLWTIVRQIFSSNVEGVVPGSRFQKGQGIVGRGCSWSSIFSDFRHVDLFRRYSRSKSKVVRNRVEFCTFFSRSKILGGGYSKNCTHIITRGTQQVYWKKFSEDTSTSPGVIEAHTLNFSVNFIFFFN